jgi:glycosyltransferase involved in cell wall biosynthesis
MIIGIDAGCLSGDLPSIQTGTQRIVSELLSRVAQRDSDNDYRLYSFDRIQSTYLEQLGNRMNNIVLPPAKLYWNIRLPFELHLHHVDVFVGFSQAMQTGAFQKIGFIYDLGFFHIPSAYSNARQLIDRTRHLFSHTDLIMTLSKSTHDDIISLSGQVSSRVKWSYPGISSIFSEKGERHKANRPYFIYVGDMRKSKNIGFLIRSFSRFLHNEKTGFLLYCIGNVQNLDHSINQFIREEGLDSCIRFIGSVSDAELAKYYRGAIALVFPSHWEGFGFPAAEAMACGCPVLASPNGSLPEIIGKGGICCKTDEIAWVTWMVKLAHEHEFRRKIIHKGLRESKKFSWNTFTSLFISSLSLQ